jgi:hypothetical protein
MGLQGERRGHALGAARKVYNNLVVIASGEPLFYDRCQLPQRVYARSEILTIVKIEQVETSRIERDAFGFGQRNDIGIDLPSRLRRGDESSSHRIPTL